MADFAADSVVASPSVAIADSIPALGILSFTRRRIFQAAYDSGTGGRVYWVSYDEPLPDPPPHITSPNYTGTLSSYHIVFKE